MEREEVVYGNETVVELTANRPRGTGESKTSLASSRFITQSLQAGSILVTASGIATYGIY